VHVIATAVCCALLTAEPSRRLQNKIRREKKQNRRRSLVQAEIIAEAERKKAKMAQQRAWAADQAKPKEFHDEGSHYYIVSPESKRPFFGEHCLVSHMAYQYTARAVGKDTVKVLRLHYTHFKEFILTSEVCIVRIVGLCRLRKCSLCAPP